MPRKFRKYKLLFDENFHRKEALPFLNSIFDLKHQVGDFKKSGLTDTEVYALAIKHKRLIVTFNAEDFKPIAAKSKETGIIGVSANLTTEQIDKNLTALLKRKTPGELFGKYTYVSGETASSLN